MNTYIHTYIHTCIHTYIHTYTCEIDTKYRNRNSDTSSIDCGRSDNYFYVRIYLSFLSSNDITSYHIISYIYIYIYIYIEGKVTERYGTVSFLLIYLSITCLYSNLSINKCRHTYLTIYVKVGLKYKKKARKKKRRGKKERKKTGYFGHLDIWTFISTYVTFYIRYDTIRLIEIWQTAHVDQCHKLIALSRTAR